MHLIRKLNFNDSDSSAFSRQIILPIKYFWNAKTDMRVRDIHWNFAFVETSYAYSQIPIHNITSYSDTHLF